MSWIGQANPCRAIADNSHSIDGAEMMKELLMMTEQLSVHGN
jgi:hypothetical protein